MHDELNMKSRGQKKHSNDPTLLKVIYLHGYGQFFIVYVPVHVQVSEEGALFRSYTDCRKVLLTPESSVQTQKALG